MNLKEISDIQLTEMTMRCTMEYEQSYLYSVENNLIEYPSNISELEMTREHDYAVKQVKDATDAYYKFIRENAEWFI